MELWEKSETVDPEVRAYVYSLVNAVGGSSTYDSTYAIGDDALAVLKDLQRWLKLYDEKTGRMDVKRCIAEANLVKGDLLEILALWPAEKTENKMKSRLALACLELLVPLTWPLELDPEKATVNHHRHVPYLQLAQVAYKRAVMHYEDAKILRTVVRIALPSMAISRRDRSRRDESIIRLVLYFFRNIAIISQPQHLPSQGDENEVSRSATIDAFHHQDIFNLLLTIGSGMSDEFREHDVLMMEILFQLVKGIDPQKLFMQKQEMADEEINELTSLIRKEKAMHNSYNKHAPTRHNRFGTMIWVKRDGEKVSTLSGQLSITDETTTLQQMDASKKWNKPRYRGRQNPEAKEQTEIGARVELTDSARKHLKHFVEDFLDSSFNPLFSSLRKAIESEAERVQESVHNKQFFFLISWFLGAETARHGQKMRNSAMLPERSSQEVSGENMFAYIAAVLDQETFVLINRRMQNALDNKEWQDLQATLLCFTQILLTVQKMSESEDEEDQEIAENIQNRIFYEEATHDRLVQILRGYAHQGFAYLDAVTECVHNFVRMLERYSKQNVDLQVRSKRRARKKQKAQAAGGTGDAVDDAEERAEDEREAFQAVSERKFDFARFSAKFLSQPCVNTFMTLLQYHNDLTASQLKRCHRYLYRLAFKHELAVMLFRVDCLQLLHKIIKGPGGLDPGNAAFKEWEQLVQQIFRRCIKWMDRPTEGQGWKETAVVEMLFSKIPGTVFYLQNGFERVVEKRPPRPPAELEVKASVAEDQRIAVAVSMMIEQAKGDALDWIKRRMTEAAAEREAWEDLSSTRAAPDDTDAPATAPDDSPTIFLLPDSDERKEAMFKDKHLRLLLTTLGVQRLGLAEETEASWIFPSDLTSASLKAAVEQIQKVEFDPPSFEGDKTAGDLIRTKPTGRRGAVFSDDSDEEASGDINDAMFPANIKEKRRSTADDEDRPRKRRKRNAAELTEAELDARAQARRKKEKEKAAKIKSNLFVTASDDESDEERDAKFYRLEEQRRRRMDGIIRTALLERMDDEDEDEDQSQAQIKRGKKKQPRRKRESRKRNELDTEDEDMQEATDDEASGTDDAQPGPISISDDESSSADDENEKAESSDDETPSTSPGVVDPLPRSPPLKEVSSNASRSLRVTANDEDDEDDDPVVKRASGARRNIRAGFVINDDSDDED